MVHAMSMGTNIKNANTLFMIIGFEVVRFSPGGFGLFPAA